MTDYRQLYNNIETALKGSTLWHDMLNVKEDSSYHREANVGEHTRMTIRWYEDNLASSRDEHSRFLTKLALLFHDVGKPAARSYAYSKTRDAWVYRYPAHEQRSARMFENFVMANHEICSLTSADFYVVRAIIEHHLPYDIKDVRKLNALRYHFDNIVGMPNAIRAFADALLSDAHGRISDDYESNTALVRAWVANFLNHEYTMVSKEAITADAPVAYFLVGPSGVGKSTFSKMRFPELNVFSHDRLRMIFTAIAKTDAQPEGHKLDAISVTYSDAWHYCCEHEAEFKAYIQQMYDTALSYNESFIIDNTNLSKKARANLVNKSRQKGYIIAMVEFPTALQTVIDRQHSRDDKCVPAESVTDHFNAIQPALIGAEADIAYMYIHNTLLLIGASERCYDFTRTIKKDVQMIVRGV